VTREYAIVLRLRFALAVRDRFDQPVLLPPRRDISAHMPMG